MSCIKSDADLNQTIETMWKILLHATLGHGLPVNESKSGAMIVANSAGCKSSKREMLRSQKVFCDSDYSK